MYEFQNYPQEIRKYMTASDKPVLFTVGHSNHAMCHFLEILKMNHIDAIADVRSSPYSKFAPQFNRDLLKKSLNEHRIYYVFMGAELGARRVEAECYENTKVIYRKVADLTCFKTGMVRLCDGAKKMRVAVMCAEKDPLTCHRTLLIAHYSQDQFSDILHILENGRVESRAEANLRLLRECKLEKEDFFCTYAERLELAYSKRCLSVCRSKEYDQL